MATMKRIQYHQYGGPEVMRLEDFEPARLRAGEVLVGVRAAAANPMDWKIRNGDMKIVTGRKFPRGMGYDFAGVVEAVGQGVTRLSVGDEVLGGTSLKAAGAFAEMLVAEEKGVVKKPAGQVHIVSECMGKDPRLVANLKRQQHQTTGGQYPVKFGEHPGQMGIGDVDDRVPGADAADAAIGDVQIRH